MGKINFEEIGPFLISEDGTITVAGRESSNPSLVLNGALLSTALPIFDKFNCRQLTLMCHDGDPPIDLSPITDLANVRRLSISSNKAAKFSLGSGASRKTFGGLIDLEIKGKVPEGFPDILELKKLRKLSIEHDKNRQEWLECDAVVDLKVSDYKADSLVALKQLASTRRLCIVGGTLRSLFGIAALPALQTLHCVSTKKLAELDAVNSAATLVNLKFENYSVIKLWDFLGEIDKWKELSLECADSVSFLQYLKKLEFFHCKKILDGDKSPIENHKNLKLHRLQRERLQAAGTPSPIGFYESLVEL